MYKWINVNTGKFKITEERNIINCPKCHNQQLHKNRYKDLEVVSHNKNHNDISICINMVFCSDCSELYIRTDY